MKACVYYTFPMVLGGVSPSVCPQRRHPGFLPDHVCSHTQELMDILSLIRGLGGLVFVTALAFVFSRNRRSINWRLVLIGIVLQFAFAFLVLQTTIGRDIFFQISRFFVVLFSFAADGAQFVFGSLAKGTGH